MRKDKINKGNYMFIWMYFQYNNVNSCNILFILDFKIVVMYNFSHI